MKKILAMALCVALMTGCSSQVEAPSTTMPSEAQVQTSGQTTVQLSSEAALLSLTFDEQFTDNDNEVGVMFASEQTITLADNGSTADDDSVVIAGNVITITQEGSYRVSGQMTEGQLVIDVDEQEKVQLILDGVALGNATTAAVYAPSCDKLFVTLNGENTLSSMIVDTEESNVDAALFAQGDLTLNGAGALTITSTNGNGITSKDDLVVMGGAYHVTADGHGLEANDSIRIADGAFTLITGKDGLHADDDDLEKGYIYIVDGTFDIVAQGDGIDSSSQVQVDGGDYAITTGGGSALNEYTGMSQAMGGRTEMMQPEMQDATVNTGRMDKMQSELGGQMPMDTAMQGELGGQMPMDTAMQGQMDGQMQMDTTMQGELGGQMSMDTAMQGQMGGHSSIDMQTQNTMGNQTLMGGQSQMTQVTTVDAENSVSAKGIKATAYLLIRGGTFDLDTFDDGIHSNGNVSIDDGIFTIATGDDAIHADWNTTISGGAITITTCYEGIEGQQVEVLGGTIDIYALDDGINASRGENAMEGDVFIRVAGGEIDLDTYNEGDGVDSNGDIEMTGGTLRISGTTATTDTPLDYSGDSWITGGTFLVAGSSSRTSQNFGVQSTQCSIWVELTGLQSGTFTLSDATGHIVAEYTPTKEYQTLGISTPELTVGETYTLVAGTETITIEMDEILYGEGNEGSMMGGMNVGQMGGQQEGGMSGRR